MKPYPGAVQHQSLPKLGEHVRHWFTLSETKELPWSGELLDWWEENGHTYLVVREDSCHIHIKVIGDVRYSKRKALLTIGYPYLDFEFFISAIPQLALKFGLHYTPVEEEKNENPAANS